ncbi:9202_t:CDS:2 [Paraglomus brasilianum]|uniref:9202_t:CDS:1 n=1 Tax=Paraglomus brasilianum TaxID=144538 RepID=A0A9N9DDD9_9GLOM|nr:9202_t:CDS:2 [Paraglomus brasilianum]
MQNPPQVLLGNPPIQNSAENPVPIPAQNAQPAPKGDLISFDENPPMHQPAQLREVNVQAVDLLTDDIPDIKVGPNEEWFDLMEKLEDNEDNEPSDSEYDTADEDPDVN